ncbi:MAG: GtrA family protein [Gallionella sp.]|nr:GtrA family protein [Gallionella sp.]
MMRHEFPRFLLVGASNTVFSFLLYYWLLDYLGYLPAYAVAYCAGIVFSYFLNVRFVFKQPVSFIGFLKFPLVYIIQYALGAAALWLLVGLMGMSPVIAMVGVIVITLPVTFLASRYLLTK